MSFAQNLNITMLLAAVGIAVLGSPQAVASPQSQDVQRAEQILQDRGLPWVNPADLENYRAQFMTILASLHGVAEIYESPRDQVGGAADPKSSRARAVEAMELVQELTHAELTLLISAVPDLTTFVRAADELHYVAHADRARPRGIPPFSHNSVGFPNAPYSGQFGSTRPTTAGLLAAAEIYYIAEGFREGFSRPCDQVIAGFSASLACIATDAVFVAAKVVYTNIQFWNDDVDSAEILGSYQRTEHLHGDIEFVQTSVDAIIPAINAHDTSIDVSIAAHNANIDTDLAAHDANIDADLAAHNANIDADLVAHDANIDADLVAHNANIDADLVAHNANIDADLVVHNANLSMHNTLVQGLVGNVQGTLDNEVELRRVHMQVLEIVNRRNYLIVTTEAGTPINVDFTSIEAYDESTGSFIGLGAATVNLVDTGTYALTLNLSGSTPSKIFRIKVVHSDVIDHVGHIVFHRSSVVAGG